VLLTELKEALANTRGRHSIDAQVDIITREKASKINQNQLTIASLLSNAILREILMEESHLQIFKFLTKELLHGRALTVEDVVDLLTLKNNEADHVEDYATALYLLARDVQMPTGRRLSAFRSVWRRIYNHDEYVCYEINKYFKQLTMQNYNPLLLIAGTLSVKPLA
jgi:nuclear pore complex protein Nup133